MGHVIIEGLDKTGKSTLAKFLSEKTGKPIKKFSNPKGTEDVAVEYVLFAAGAQSCIVDRMHLSEMAYGPVLRGKSDVDESVQRLIEGLLAERGSTVGVFCYANREELERRFKEDGEDLIDASQIQEIEENFEKALRTSRMSWIMYKVGDDMEKVYEQVR